MQLFDTVFPFEVSLLEDEEKLNFRKRKRELTAIYREKAEMAIKALNQGEGSLPKLHSYFCSIDNNFRFKRDNIEHADYGIDVTWDEVLTISVIPLHGDFIKESTCVSIKSRDGKWPLGVEKVVLKTNFEQELISNAIKANLVQLNGYYQYPPKS